MNYEAHYNRLIERARSRELDGYSEAHHVVPRCMGGSDEPSNIVRLTPEEHYVAHQLLVKMNPNVGALVYAANMMTVGRGNKCYGWLKRRYVSECRKRTGAANGATGSMWIHRGLKNKKILKTEPIPEGWEKGRNIKHKTANCKVCNKTINYRAAYCNEHKPFTKKMRMAANKRAKEALIDSERRIKDVAKPGMSVADIMEAAGFSRYSYTAAREIAKKYARVDQLAESANSKSASVSVRI